MIVNCRDQGCTGLASYISRHADGRNHHVGYAAGYSSAALRPLRSVLMEVDDPADIGQGGGGIEAKLGIRDGLRRVVVLHHKGQGPSAIHACSVAVIRTARAPVARGEA